VAERDRYGYSSEKEGREAKILIMRGGGKGTDGFPGYGKEKGGKGARGAKSKGARH